MASETTCPTSSSALHDFLIQLGTPKVQHSGRSLYEHLCGVNSVLQAWEQPVDVCNAGMFHSIYSTEKFQHVTLSTNQRSWLKERIGEQAERLVYLFATIPRVALFEAVKSWSSLLSDPFVEIPSRWDGTIVAVSGTEMADLLLIHIANRLEQASKPSTGIGSWLARTSELVENLATLSKTLPPVLAGLGMVTVNDERHLQSLYLQGVGRLQSDDPDGAVTFLDPACRHYGFVGEPHLMLAVAHRWLRNSQSAQLSASKGRMLLKSWGAPWHKNLSLDGWCALADLITNEAPIEEVRSVLCGISVAHDKAQWMVQTEVFGSNGYDSLTTVSQPGASRLCSYLKAVKIHRSKHATNWYPGLSRKSWYDPEQFPIARQLESRFAEIRAEALKVNPSSYYEEAEDIGRTGSWQVCMFYEQGRRNDAVCVQCPTTTKVIEGDPAVRRSAGLIYLSKMAARTHIATHQARSNIRLRCHLAITIPEGDCAIRVGNEVHRWEEGKCIVFDDTFEHEVWNRTNQERLVLLVDLWHPDLTEIERDALDAINWLSMQKATGMIGTWQRNDSQRDKEGKQGVDLPREFD